MQPYTCEAGCTLPFVKGINKQDFQGVEGVGSASTLTPKAGGEQVVRALDGILLLLLFSLCCYSSFIKTSGFLPLSNPTGVTEIIWF